MTKIPKTVRETTLGKFRLRLLKTDTGYAGALFHDGALKIRIDEGNEDDIWRQLHDEAAKGSPNFIGYDGARARFLRIFGGGLDLPSYVNHERRYKLEAKARLEADAPLEKARDASGLGEVILKVFQATNLVSPFEKMRMADALRSRDADAFIRGAAAFTLGDMHGLQQMEAALKPHDAAKWTAVTYLPFLWQPKRHMFLKPEVTKQFAARVGHPFAHDYESKLDAQVYLSLLDLMRTLEKEVADLMPADWIDLQSFIWVVGEYTAEDVASVPQVS